MARAPYSAPGLLPFPNPVSDWVAPRRNALLGFGSGLLSSNMGDIGTSTMRGMELDRQIGQEQQDFMQAQEEENATKEYLRSKGYNDLLAGVEGGGLDIGTAWAEALKRGQPVAPDYTTDMQNFMFAQENPEFAAFIGQGDQPAAPSGYAWNGSGGLSFIPGGPADPALAAAKPPTEAERKAGALTTVTQKDAGLLFGTPEKPGIFEALGGWGDSALQANIPFTNAQPLAGLASSDFKVAKDAISNITQSYLYAMSGATAPPEEVRKIAEQVTPQPFDSPAQKQAKRDRLLAMYQAIEGAQGNAARPQMNSGTTSSGVPWSIGQ